MLENQILNQQFKLTPEQLEQVGSDISQFLENVTSGSAASDTTNSHAKRIGISVAQWIVSGARRNPGAFLAGHLQPVPGLTEF